MAATHTVVFGGHFCPPQKWLRIKSWGLCLFQIWCERFSLLYCEYKFGKNFYKNTTLTKNAKRPIFSTPHHSSHSRKRITMHWSRQIRFLDRSTVLIHLFPNFRTKLSLAQNSDQCIILLAGHIWSDYVHILAILVISAGQQYLNSITANGFCWSEA